MYLVQIDRTFFKDLKQKKSLESPGLTEDTIITFPNLDIVNTRQGINQIFVVIARLKVK